MDGVTYYNLVKRSREERGRDVFELASRLLERDAYTVLLSGACRAINEACDKYSTPHYPHSELFRAMFRPDAPRAERAYWMNYFPHGETMLYGAEQVEIGEFRATAMAMLAAIVEDP